MHANLILSSSWKVYDEYKVAVAQNVNIFFPDKAFEVSFLVIRIRQICPQYSEDSIVSSINRVARTLYAGCSRKLFVELVMDQLLTSSFKKKELLNDLEK